MDDIKGPAILLAQFLRKEAPFNNLENITRWAKSLGYKGVQIPANEKTIINIDIAAESKDYCDELKGKCSNLEITEIATHLFGQLGKLLKMVLKVYLMKNLIKMAIA